MAGSDWCLTGNVDFTFKTRRGQTEEDNSTSILLKLTLSLLFFFICLKRFLIFFFLNSKVESLSKKPNKGHMYFNIKGAFSFFIFFSSKFDRQTVSHLTYFHVLYPFTTSFLIINDDRFVIKNYFLNQ